MMWRRVTNPKTSVVMLVGASHRPLEARKNTIYTKNNLFWPAAGAEKMWYFDPKYGGLLEKK